MLDVKRYRSLRGSLIGGQSKSWLYNFAHLSFANCFIFRLDVFLPLFGLKSNFSASDQSQNLVQDVLVGLTDRSASFNSSICAIGGLTIKIHHFFANQLWLSAGRVLNRQRFLLRSQCAGYVSGQIEKFRYF